MVKRVLIYGAGGHAKTVISLLRLLDMEIAGIVDDGVPAGTSVSGVKVLGGELRGSVVAEDICLVISPKMKPHRSFVHS